MVYLARGARTMHDEDKERDENGEDPRDVGEGKPGHVGSIICVLDVYMFRIYSYDL